MTWRMTWRRLSSEMGCSPSGSIHLCVYELVITLGASMAWFREGRGRGRLEGVHVKSVERGALLLGELDEAIIAGAAASGAARALARALVVRPLVVGQALGPGARRAAALALGHLLARQARLRRRLLLVLLHVTAAVGVDADGQHEGFVALDALVALDLVLGLGGGGDVRRHACGCGCVLLVLGFPAGYAGVVCLRAGCGFSLRAGSVRGFEALCAVARPRAAMAACVGCFLLFGGLPSASRRARFCVRARAAPAHIYI